MTSNIKATMLAGAAVLAVVIYWSVFSGTANDPAPEAADEPAVADQTAAGATLSASHPAISVVPAQLAVLKDRVRASGLVAAVERVLVQPQIEGQPIDSILAQVGDHVAAGTVLAQLSDTSLRLQKSQLMASRAAAVAQIAQAEAQLVEARSTAEEANRARNRADQLRKQGNLSQAALDLANSLATSAAARVTVAVQGALAAKAQLELADAQLENVDLQLSRTQVKAPFTGEIVEKNAVAGGIASAAGSPMFVLVRDGLLELNADVAEQDLPRLSPGLPVTMQAAGYAIELTGKVRLVEPAIDTTTRLGRIRITIDQAERVRSGMFLGASIAISEREVLAVPITALGTDEQGSFVMTVDDDGLVHRVGVGTGVRDGDLIEIAYGVTKGTNVVAKAASFVRDGDTVNPVLVDSAPATN